ncbi:uncharacterized protein EV420DRAFT_1652713 [Desarmillaria tabescens]|uniref:Uncharacterized protein n=1 Tax=Armillaria tabescens TaxID=1929756 RepID=A0AA39MIY8_ARMTA|nr:uncharacterized protein EV420DRAFT_1652713 [Desarmillaria tabescens]KAK0436082.1 hypothetical protein EV420DRAFT_1652713 [Desarmillaria tabescens]
MLSPSVRYGPFNADIYSTRIAPINCSNIVECVPWGRNPRDPPPDPSLLPKCGPARSPHVQPCIAASFLIVVMDGQWHQTERGTSRLWCRTLCIHSWGLMLQETVFVGECSKTLKTCSSTWVRFTTESDTGSRSVLHPFLSNLRLIGTSQALASVRSYPMGSPLRSQSQEPPITVSVSSAVASLSSSVANGYVIDDLVAEMLVNRPRIPPLWPTHLDSFRDSLDHRDLYVRSLVLVVPGNIHLIPGSAPPTMDWVVPRSCPAWRVVTEAVGGDENARMQVNTTVLESSEMASLVSLCDSMLITMDSNFRLRNGCHGAVA